MNLPFGLQFKSIVVGILIAWFLLPRVMGLFAAKKAA